jgi:two-component sensor histidine kinase
MKKTELMRHKDLMNLESDHRLMNGLQMVSSLLSLQSHEAQNTKTAEQLKIAANRVATIGSVHKRLHALDHVRSVELKQYLENLCQDIRGILPAEADHNLAVEGIALEVPTAIGIPLGYIVSELVTNSAKYAKGKITVRLDRNPGEGYELSVSDDGPGFPEGLLPYCYPIRWQRTTQADMRWTVSSKYQKKTGSYGTGHYGLKWVQPHFECGACQSDVRIGGAPTSANMYAIFAKNSTIRPNSARPSSSTGS